MQLRLTARRWIERSGYRVTRIHAKAAAHAAVGPTPRSAIAELTSSNPRLAELRGRYAAFASPLCAHTHWSPERRAHDLDLAAFRGDNAYVWQRRHLGDDVALRYLAYLQYIESIDRRGLLRALDDDGLFGAWTFSYGRPPVVTRDLLDSINELYFLDRACRLFDRDALSVLDVGAGYGRLAHRMLGAVAGVERYYCVDAVADSTFLCEYYLGFRGVLGRAVVVPVDEVATAIAPGAVALAVNIHGFSEMSLVAVEAWIAELVRLEVPALLVVPNEPDDLLTIESDGRRKDFGPALAAAGFRLTVREPVIADPAVRDAMGVGDAFWFFEA